MFQNTATLLPLALNWFGALIKRPLELPEYRKPLIKGDGAVG
jgi:hypothetical protein